MTATATEFRNGRHTLKASGDTVFKGKLAHTPPPTPIDCIEEAAERMFTDGFIQFPDLFSTDESAEIREWMDRIGEPDEKYEFKNWCFNKEVMADYRNDPMWQRFVDRDPVPRVLKLVFGSDAYVNWSKIWVTGKGRAMGMHIDHFDVLLPEDVLMDERVRIPVFNATLHLYFEDQIEEMGPTLVIPGSHRAGRAPQDESTWHGIEPKMVSVKAGGGVLFRHDLWHGAAMNSSTRRRHLVQVRYVESRDQRHQERPCTPAVWAQSTAEQRKLLALQDPGKAEARAAPQR